jgi:hypothetical protein
VEVLWGLVFTNTTNNLRLDAPFGGKCDRPLMLVHFITLVLMLAIRSPFTSQRFNSSSLHCCPDPNPKTSNSVIAELSQSLSLHSR